MPLRITRQYVEALAPPPQGELRVTRQYIEVLSDPPAGDLRITRQYIEVLASPFAVYEENLTDTLNLTDEVRIPERIITLNSVITFVDKVRTTFFERLTTEISFYDIVGRTYEASLADSITFADNITRLLVIGEHAGLSDTLEMTQEVVWSAGLNFALEDVINFVETLVDQSPIYRTIWHRMHLYSFMPVEDYFEKLTDELTLTDSAGREYEENVASIISFTDSMFRSEGETSVMNLVQSLDWGKTKGIPIQYLNLTQSIGLRGDWTRSLVDDIGIGHAFTYYLEDPCNKKQYIPFTGESTVNNRPTPPDPEPPLVQGLPEGERFMLLWPAAGESTDIVELRAPNLDNRERQAFTRINRETRGGTLSIFSDPTWPSINTLVLSFSGLSKTEVEEVQTFMVAHIGQEVGLFDWEGRLWTGIITTPNEQAVQDGKGAGSCIGRYTISFEFEGVLIESTPSGSAMNVTDELSYIADWDRPLDDAINFTSLVQFYATLNRSLTDVMTIVDDVQETVENP